MDRVLGGSASIARRLREAGRDESVTRFRGEQVLWGVVGFVIGAGRRADPHRGVDVMWHPQGST